MITMIRCSYFEKPPVVRSVNGKGCSLGCLELLVQGTFSLEPAYLDELYSQVRGVYLSAKNIREIDVSGAEPDMAFIPPKD
jgi:hypothetical protein